MSSKRKIEFKQDFESIRIYIDGIIHIYIIKKFFQGFSCYKQQGLYYIEIYLKKTILIAHEDKNNWTDILKCLNDNI